MITLDTVPLLSTFLGRCLIILVAVFLAASCDAISDPDAPSRETLEALLAKKAGREEIGASLVGKYTWYAPDTKEWEGLLQFLDGPEGYAPVREAVKRKQKIMYHTTMWQQTWIFLNDSEHFESYWLNSQSTTMRRSSRTRNTNLHASSPHDRDLRAQSGLH
jgi:hypothetical protein